MAGIEVLIDMVEDVTSVVHLYVHRAENDSSPCIFY